MLEASVPITNSLKKTGKAKTSIESIADLKASKASLAILSQRKHQFQKLLSDKASVIPC